MKVEHKIRTTNGKTKVVTLTYKSAIIENCLHCMGWIPSEVENCSDPLCPLYPFRNAKATKGRSGRKSNPKAIKALKNYRDKK